MTGFLRLPSIVEPGIVREYSQSEVTTLHQQNLLPLGEDSFLTIILLRTFPGREMMFLPQAKCRTVVPDTFKSLLSQRRRGINSTIHNLKELVLVRNLASACSLWSTWILGWSYIALTYEPPTTFEEAIPFMLLVSVLG